MTDQTRDVAAVIGGGPAGLAAAATLKPLGLRVRILEKADAVGARWRGHYDRLHLHTTRKLSQLPGLDIPREYGRWVSRDDFAKYQESYAQHHGLELEFGTSVERIDRIADGWRVTTSKGPIEAGYVVVGTGYNNVPFTPPWPGREQYAGEIVHSGRYRNGAAYKGKRVLVVGAGNSGAEIAVDLAENGAEVWWSFRTPPTIVPRAVLGIATQAMGIMLRPLPPAIVDPIISVFGRLTIGSLKKFGLPRPTRGAYTAILRDHVLPILDVGFAGAVRAGTVKPIGTIASFDKREVVFGDGQKWTPDAVVVCCGFRTGLESMIGHLNVLDKDGIPLVAGPKEHANAPNMYFLGYTNAVSGNLREIAAHARRVARTIAAERKRATMPLLEKAAV